MGAGRLTDNITSVMLTCTAAMPTSASNRSPLKSSTRRMPWVDRPRFGHDDDAPGGLITEASSFGADAAVIDPYSKVL